MIDSDRKAAIEHAKRYYYYILQESMAASGQQFISMKNLYAIMKVEFGTEGQSEVNIHIMFSRCALHDFIDNSWIEIVHDEFADDYVRVNENTLGVEGIDETFAILKEKITSLGGAGDGWVKSALRRIVREFGYDEIEQYYKQLPAIDYDKIHQQDLNVEGQETDIADEEPLWEPLKIDRESAEYKEAIDATEAALHEIESSNGYASSEPEERNGIVNIMKGTLEAIKFGAPSKESIKSGLLKPLRYIAKKFSDSTMGEIAKIAVAKLVEWLF